MDNSHSFLSPLVTLDDHQLQQQQVTLISAVDYKGRPALRSKHGRWRSAAFIIVVEMAERLSFYGISGNLIMFLTGKLGQSTATAAANVNAWNGVAALLPVLGGVIADSFLGKFYTIILASLLYILGLSLLTLSAMIPFNCATSTIGCTPHTQIIMFFTALYLVAVGQGGHKPCVQAFGADQFDDSESKAKSSFFNWWYFGVCLGALLGIAVLSYVQDNYSWGLGFGIPCIIMIIALLIFLLGTVTYRYMAGGEGPSPFLRVRRVFVAAAKNWFLDKALFGNDPSKEAGESCSVGDVEEAKIFHRKTFWHNITSEDWNRDIHIHSCHGNFSPSGKKTPSNCHRIRASRLTKCNNSDECVVVGSTICLVWHSRSIHYGWSTRIFL